MSTFFARRRSKAATIGVLVASIGVAASAAVLTAPAGADTAPGYVTSTASTATQANVPATTGTLSGLVDGQAITVEFNATGAGNQVPRVEVRQCRDGSDIGSFTQFRPSTGGRCATDFPVENQFLLSGGANSAGEEYRDLAADNFPALTHVGGTFLVNTGTALNAQAGGANIVCDVDSACELWARTLQPQGTEAYVHWELTFAGAPDAPTGVTATSVGGNSLSVAFAPPADTGNAPITTYIVTATPQGGGSAVTANGAASPITVPSLALGAYDVTVVAENTASDGTTHFQSAAATATGTVTEQAPGAPVLISASPDDGAADLTWTNSDPSVTSFEVLSCSPAPCTPTTGVNTGSTATSYTLTGLTNGVRYNVAVRGLRGTLPSATSNVLEVVPNATLITQTITVRRPNGALVLTQECGARGADIDGTAPTINGGPATDPLYPGYPYPEDPATGDSLANYPTDCAVQLGIAHLITSGPGAGQYFRSTGFINQVSVVDTRNADAGWNVTGTMGNFSSGADSFSGSHLGWVPIKTSDTGPFDHDLDEATPDYDQTVAAGATVSPSTRNGLGNGETLASAPANAGLGIAVLDADLNLNIPVTADSGVYVGILTITAI